MQRSGNFHLKYNERAAWGSQVPPCAGKKKKKRNRGGRAIGGSPTRLLSAQKAKVLLLQLAGKGKKHGQSKRGLLDIGAMGGGE